MCPIWQQSKAVSDRQGACRKGVSSLHSAMLLQETIFANLEGGNRVYVAYLDVSKAFSPGHITHTSTVRAVCGQFTAEIRGGRRITLRVPQGVGLNRRGRAVENQWSWAVERFANMFANQSTVHVCRTDICGLSV